MKMSTIPTVVLGKMVWIIIILSAYYVLTFGRTIISLIKIWPYRKALRKFKKICRRKHISKIIQECIIIKKYTEEFEIINNKIIHKPPIASSSILKPERPQKETKETQEKTEKENEPKWYPNGWYLDPETGKWIPPDFVEESSKDIGSLVYNEKTRMWVSKEQCDPIENQRKYEENRRNWENFKEQEARKEENRNRVEKIIANSQAEPNEKEKAIKELYWGQYDRYSDFTDEELRLILQTQRQKRQKEPTFEEWKAAKEAEKHQDE